jgi:hypothetical protein
MYSGEDEERDVQHIYSVALLYWQTMYFSLFFISFIKLKCWTMSECLGMYDHIFSIFVMKLCEVRRVKVLFMLCVVPRMRGPDWVILEGLWRSVSSCLGSGIWPMWCCVCVVDGRNRIYYKCSDKVYTPLTFRGPCIVIYFYYKSQRDAQFLKFIW